ncbi:MAG: class I SAM-dependent methyltransferase [Chloroflexota bacterium]|nr:MAG: hypothetical protein DLM70_08745 [Chloroflexota bacterium]
MHRVVKDCLKAAYFHLYILGMRLGVAVIPVHYYSSEPDIARLEKTKEAWSAPSSLAGIHVDLDEQARVLSDVCVPYRHEYAGNQTYLSAVQEGFGPGYGFIEAQALHGVIRHFRPKRIVEVGSGVSTACSLHATGMNERDTGNRAVVRCVEPFPSVHIRRLAREGAVELVDKPVQETSTSVFADLEANDVLFIDSSHVVKAGSDVVHIVLEILPRLNSGVVVHIHDIYFPYIYQRDLLQTFLHNNETPFVAAFLAFNPGFRILFSLSHLHYERTDSIRNTFPDYRLQPGWRGLRLNENLKGTHYPSALWLTVA